MVNAWEASQAQKRGGGATFVSPDHAGAEERFLADPTASPDFDAAYEHDWAMTLLDRTMVTLRKHYADLGQEAVFEKLKPCLTATRGDIPYEEMARDLGMNEGAVRTAVSRLRKKFRETFRACVADTVEDGDEVEREMSHIIGIIAGV